MDNKQHPNREAIRHRYARAIAESHDGKHTQPTMEDYRSADAILSLLSSPSPDQGEGEAIPVTAELVSYVQAYGGRCRDCADEAGICPQTGIGCGESEKAIRWVLRALNYGWSHRFLPAPWLATPPVESAKPGEMGWLIEEDAGGITHWISLATDEWPRRTYETRRARMLRDNDLLIEEYKSSIVRVKDASAAIRFARQADAEAFIALFERFLLHAKATEHQWPASPPEPQPQLGDASVGPIIFRTLSQFPVLAGRLTLFQSEKCDQAIREALTLTSKDGLG